MTRLIKESVIFAVIIILLSSTYLIFSWNKYNNEASARAISLVESVEAFIPDEQIKELSGSSEDLGTPEYEMIKQNLTELVETANPIRFSYLMTKKEDNIVILADSEASGSAVYSHPGQLYEEAADIFAETFESGQTVITEPETDRWGTWISALVPVKDPVSGNH